MNAIKIVANCLALAALLSLCPAADARPWKDSAGKRTVEAEFVSLADGKVTLKRTDGKLVTMALNTLSAADQKVAKELASKAAPAAEAAAVELIGLAISKPIDPSSGLASFVSMMSNGGTALTFVVSAGDRHFVGFDDKSSQITSCQDDQGTDLNPAKDDGNSFGMFGPFNASVSEDGTKCQVTATAAGIPAHGALKIVFEGTVAILCGKDEKTEEQKDVALEADSKITVGPVPLTIESVQDQDFGDVKFMITINSSQPRDAIKQLEFVGDDGKVIEHESMGSGSFGFGEEMTYQTSFGLKAKVEKVTVRVTYYSNVETLKIPVKIETGVGL